ncbi:ABC transporter ATP-binding protein [Treponema sp. OMZ 906]|uniref:ABC transporter ATP-binding protein n=1 Tax=Treponema sp. OMZ 906 TaxID=2563662 RepID=UPI0020A5CC47|nr:ABC transporter ATP-binding protein [Treponema sp. OMZ 906]UTC54726.1 ABC transporter ATP-binding protein [Treponema sp. OMZ 906]
MFDLLKKIYAIAGKQSKRITTMFICDMLKSIFEGFTLGGLGYFLLTLSRAVFQSQPVTRSNIITVFCIMLVSLTGKIIFGYISDRNKNIASYTMGAENRLFIGDKLKNVHMGYFSESKLGDISGALTTVITDVETINMMILEMMFAGGIQTVIMALFVFPYDMTTGCIIFITLVVAIVFNNLFQKRTDAVTTKLTELKLQLHTDVLEYVQGIGVVKAFGRTSEAIKNVTESIKKSKTGFFAVEKTLMPSLLVFSLLLKLGTTAIIVSALYRYSDGAIDVEKTLMLIVASFVVFGGFEIAGTMQRMRGVAVQNLDTLFTVKNIQALPEGSLLPQGNDDITVKNVTFGYGGKEQSEEKLFRNVDMSIPKNSTTALVGYSGSGKTSLCQLIARFWDVDSGEIKLGDTNIKGFVYDAFLSNFTFVFQDVYLFEDTIKNNIKFGKPDASDAEVIAAAKAAQCHDFIMELPNAYDTVLQEGGSNLSGGERQRISIARAMLKPSSIVILDEATSSVDPENEEKLMSALDELLKNKTAIIIAHRLSTIKNADQIFVMDKGSIVQHGTHSELVQQDGIYARFVGMRETAAAWRV